MSRQTSSNRRNFDSTGRRGAFGFLVAATFLAFLGICCVTVIYGVVYGAVLRPLNYPDPERLFYLSHSVTPPGRPTAQWGASEAGFLDMQRTLEKQAQLGAYSTGRVVVSTGRSSVAARRAQVTRSVLDVLGAGLLHGRWFNREEDSPGAPPVAVLSGRFWRQQFGGDENIIGGTIDTDAGSLRIIGVAADDFRLPRSGPFAPPSETAGFAVDLWEPLALSSGAKPVSAHIYAVVGRLSPGVSLEALNQAAQNVIKRWPSEFPSVYSQRFVDGYRFSVDVQLLEHAVTALGVRQYLWLLLAAGVAVWTASTINLLALIAVRALGHRLPQAIRLALGATSFRASRRQIAELVVIFVAAVSIALAVAWWLVPRFAELLPPDIPRPESLALGGEPMLVGLVVGLIMIGTATVATVRRPGLGPILQGARGQSAAKSERWATKVVVVAQVAVAVLTTGAALAVARASNELANVDVGLQMNDLSTVQVVVPLDRYPSPSSFRGFHRELQLIVGGDPRVDSVGAVSEVPYKDFGAGCSAVFRVGQPYSGAEVAPCVPVVRYTPDAFITMGVKLLEGRWPTMTSTPAQLPAVITKELAGRLWPGESPLGKPVNSNGASNLKSYVVVAVIGDLRWHGPGDRPVEAMFYPAFEPALVPSSALTLTYVIRSRATAEDVATIVKRGAESLDRLVAVGPGVSMQAIYNTNISKQRLLKVLLLGASFVSVSLAVAGLCGSALVAAKRRRREFSIRMALGATHERIARAVVAESLSLALVGIGIGALVYWLGAVYLTTVLFGFRSDAWTLSMTALILIAGVIIASVPAVRTVIRTTPASTLRS